MTGAPAFLRPGSDWSAARFLQRTLTSTALIGLTLWILFRGSPVAFGFEVAAFAALALYEFFTLLRRAGIPSFRLFGVALGTFLQLWVTFELGMTRSGDILFLVLSCQFLFVLYFFRRNNSEALIGISLTLFGMLYVGWFLSFVIKLRYLPGGIWWTVFLVLVTKAADVGAYLVGTLFGRHALVAHISPKKSVEGMFGGLAASWLAALALRGVLPHPIGWTDLSVVGLLIGLVGQIGDLSESLLKRFCNAKDSGGLLPGMGGVLDAIDSILFTAPIFYHYVRTIIG